MSTITVKTTINASAKDVWMYFTTPSDIEHWNYSSETWECPKARNELKVGGTFTYTMAAKDKSEQFDFRGIFTRIEPPNTLAYTMEDGRTAEITFNETDTGTLVTYVIEAETINPKTAQKKGWEAILKHFKQYVESQKT